MASQLEIRLKRLIQDEIDPKRRALLSAELGCYLARVGDFEHADAIRGELRKSYSDGASLKISVRLMMLEGLILYYKNLDSSGRDRILRANVLCSSFREFQLLSLTSAWLAHFDFNSSDFDLMASDIRTCFSAIEQDDGSALSRVSLVLGDAFLYSGDSQSSQYWYEKARYAATTLGDQATVGAITYNRAALNVQSLRFKVCRSTAKDEELARVQLELNTAINYQNLARLKSLDHLLTAATVGLKVTKGDFSSAAEVAKELIASQMVPVKSGEYFLLLADLVMCYAISGDFNSALSYRSRIGAGALDLLDDDDLAIIYSSLSDSASKMGEPDQSLIYRNMAALAFSNHDSKISALSRFLSEFRSEN